jgi:hypothetical protein
MARRNTEMIGGPIDKTAKSTVNIASSDDGIDQADQGDRAALDKIDAKEERAFVCSFRPSKASQITLIDTSYGDSISAFLRSAF